MWPLPGRGHEYRLTDAGKDLEPVLMALGRWAVDWMYDQLDPNDVTPEHLMWWMYRRMDVSQLPSHRVVVLFDHTVPGTVKGHQDLPVGRRRQRKRSKPLIEPIEKSWGNLHPKGRAVS